MKKNQGFTLIELMVVMAIIGIVMTLVLPNMGAMMGGESQAQAINLVDAKLKVARSMAIRTRSYVGVHFQEHWQNRGEIWCAIMIAKVEPRLGRQEDDEYEHSAGFVGYQDSTSMTAAEMDARGIYSGVKYLPANMRARFRAAASAEEPALTPLPGSTPSRIPGTWRIGPVCRDLGNSYQNLNNPSSTFNDRSSFTSFTVMFDPEGKTVKYTPQSPFNFMVYVFPGSNHAGKKDRFYTSFIFDENYPDQRLWVLPEKTDTLVNALCLYNGREFDEADVHVNGATSLGQAQQMYLNENAAFLVVNPMMGGLIRSAVE